MVIHWIAGYILLEYSMYTMKLDNIIKQLDDISVYPLD